MLSSKWLRSTCRFHKLGSPRRKSKLFLDCCALIRQVVYDLREDFGFILQRYNQVQSVKKLLIIVLPA